MATEIVGKQCHFRVSEPFDYGYETNPDPLFLELLGSFTAGGKSHVVLKGTIHSKGRVFCIGLATSRYTGDDVLSSLGSGHECIVNTSFYRAEEVGSLIGRDVNEIVSACLDVPLSDSLLLIGDLRLA